jgi:hypothetical protein
VILRRTTASASMGQTGVTIHGPGIVQRLRNYGIVINESTSTKSLASLLALNHWRHNIHELQLRSYPQKSTNSLTRFTSVRGIKVAVIPA